METKKVADTSKYQHYISAKQHTKLVTPTGRMIPFVNFKFITNDPELIAYLDKEIELRIPGITKGELLTHEEADPMQALRNKHIMEYLAKEAAGKKENIDMGSTVATGINPVSTVTAVPAAHSNSKK